jgi:hypothetical protein
MMGMPDTASVLLICKVIPSSVWADGSNRLYAAALPLNVFFDVGRMELPSSRFEPETKHN